MTAISDRFEKLAQNQECALIPFITAGDPDLATTAAALQILDQNGADIIELGIPYSDPLADGPVIQAAATRALERGINFDQVLEMLQATTPSLRSPIVLLTYYNPILHRGIDKFLQDVAAAGVSGLVVPDLPLEEAATLLEPASKMGIDVILLIAPTSSPERIEAIARYSRGFIYLVSVTGVTGVRTKVENRVSDLLKQIRNVTEKPVAVGFGISQPAQALQVKEWGADAAIVGSAFVKLLAEGTPEQGLSAIAEFCQSLKSAITTTDNSTNTHSNQEK
ncbi:tryptophan synthase subunit alpha [Nostoc sp. CENA67]|uniref:Tryptophan synthase alpha chain n=1 Tax=Amazonocrinis nigriterrae CENA67 TaxID=2794033 RepID=A0A8J7HU80_9NOST|nr:tryptophan synthase subunit alpha [Amazonocrinis nigriterrae]MBH8562614.1 tryptophan synthase subunit alpha [Amazonocrinis nigriterrae CENA67]